MFACGGQADWQNIEGVLYFSSFSQIERERETDREKEREKRERK